MKIRTRAVACSRRVLAVGVAGVLASGCSLLPGPDPTPSDPPSATRLAPPPTEFAPLAADASQGLGTGANDFDTGLAVAGNLVVASGIVYGNRLAPSFRYSTDGGASWQLGHLSDASVQDTPPDQGDQTDGIAVATVAGQTRWVAYGNDWRRPLTWTSADGRTWDRHVPEPKQISAGADVRDLAAVPGGFVLVGTDAEDKPTAWTSTDGVSWRPSPMSGQGTPVAVASQGSTVVAVGEHDDTYATWLSNDRGLTWQRGGKPPRPSDDDRFSRYLTDVTASADGFTAIGSYSASDWRPVVYRSTTGASWQQESAPATSKGDAQGWLLRADGDRELAGTHEYEPSTHPRLWTRTGGSWQEATTPLSDSSALAAGEWTLGDAVRSGNAWVVAVQLSRNGQVVSQLWRSTDGKRFAAVTRPPAELDQATALPLAMVRSADQTVVFGDSRRRPVVWSRSGSEPFGPARLVSGDARERITGAAAGPRGVLAYGNRTADGTESAVVWRADGPGWSATSAGTFSRAGRRYASSSIGQVAWLRNRWVAVGETSDNGDLNRSALVATSTDARTWTKGRAARRMTKAGGDVWYDVTDLQGDHDRTRAMHGVAAVDDRLVAVGDSVEGDTASTGRSATIWRSDDARTWSMQRLPLTGLAWSSMEQIAVRGSTVVVLGTGATGDAQPTIPVVWCSTDGGRSWQQQLLDAASAGGIRLESRNGTTELVALRSGFAVVGEQIDGTSRPVALLSDDGTSWRQLPISAVATEPGSGAVPVSAGADGDDLWLLVRSTNAAGAGSRLVVQST